MKLFVIVKIMTLIVFQISFKINLLISLVFFYSNYIRASENILAISQIIQLILCCFLYHWEPANSTGWQTVIRFS